MAFRISATTPTDADLLAAIRNLAWQERRQVSEVIRSAFLKEVNEGNDRLGDQEA
jgi:hypothetical protein